MATNRFSQTVRFVTTCPEADRMYLRLTAGPNDTRVLPMTRGISGGWFCALRLPPGAYDYRYYRVTGPLCIYHPPDDLEAPITDGLDAHLEVTQSGSGASTCPAIEFPTGLRFAP